MKEFNVTIYLNNALAQGGAYQKYLTVKADSEIKAMIIAREVFRKIDYEYMSVSRFPNEPLYLWDIDKVNELKED